MNLWKSCTALFQPAPRLRSRRWADTSPFGFYAAEVLEQRTLLSQMNGNVAVTIKGGNVTIQDSDNGNHSIQVERSGGNLIFTGFGSTLTIGNGPAGSTQTVALASVTSLTINTGTGHDIFGVRGLTISGALIVNGNSSGSIDFSVDTGNLSAATIGSIGLNLGRESATISVAGAFGGTLTVNGPVQIRQAGPASCTAIFQAVAGTLHLKSNVLYSDSGTGAESVQFFPAEHGTLEIDGSITANMGNGSAGFAISSPDQFNSGTVTINGAVTVTAGMQALSFSITGAVTIAGSISVMSGAGNDAVLITSTAVSIPTIGGSINVALGNGQNSFTLISAIPHLRVPVNGSLTVTSGAGPDSFEVSDALVKGPVTLSTGNSPAGHPDRLAINGSEFDEAVFVSMPGAGADVELETDLNFLLPTDFKGNATFSLTGPSAIIDAGQSGKTAIVIFESMLQATGGMPFGTLHVFGGVSLDPAKRKLTRFNLVS
jgi:hypothetical protein